MTHPSWPSNTWQIYSSDYDTPAAYYAVAKACEPLHAQLNLPDYRRTVVNLTRTAMPSLHLRTRIAALDGRMLFEGADKIDAPANDIVTLDAPPELQRALDREAVVLVELTLTDRAGKTVSSNLYWEAHENADLARLTKLTEVPLLLTASAHSDSHNRIVDITLRNRSRTPALLAKLTLLDAAGERVLPAYYSDNYVSLLPGEMRSIAVTCPSGGKTCTTVSLRGWNIAAASLPLQARDDNADRAALRASIKKSTYD
jgi:hypothetical protein